MHTWHLFPLSLVAALNVVACGSGDSDEPAGATTSSSTTSTSSSAGGSGAGGGSGGGGTGGAIDACPTQHDAMTGDGHAVIVCDEIFAEVPYVRPPDDAADVAFIATDGRRLYSRSAGDRDLTPEEIAVMGLGSTTTTIELRRYAFAIYRVSMDDKGAITTSAPAILVEDAPLLAFLAEKSAEGFISRHKPDPALPNFEYEQEPSLPIRVRFSAVEPYVGTPDPTYDIIHRSVLAATIENLSAPVSAANGDCLPAMTDAGAENPFDGQASVMLNGSRVPSMHVPGDNEFVIDGGIALNHMGPWIVMPHQLLLSDTIAFPTAGFAPHGNPLVMPRLTLGVVEGGGDPGCP